MICPNCKNAIEDNAAVCKWCETNFGSSNPVFGMSEKSYIILMHLSQLVAYSGIGFIAPIILWVIKKDENARVNIVGKNIINFMISMFIYYIVSAILCIVIIGFAMLLALFVMHFVFIIIAAIKANNDETWSYPLSIKFIK